MAPTGGLELLLSLLVGWAVGRGPLEERELMGPVLVGTALDGSALEGSAVEGAAVPGAEDLRGTMEALRGEDGTYPALEFARIRYGR